MIDATVKRAVRQGVKSQPVERGLRVKQGPSAFKFSPEEMAAALERARELRAKDEATARKAARRAATMPGDRPNSSPMRGKK